MLMIINHSTKAILELILFVIARKMLIYSHTMLDLVLGTLASTKVKDILRKTGFDIPMDKGVTVGGLVCSLADEACVAVEEGAEFISGDIKIEIVKATDGLIEAVKITKNIEDESEAH